MKTPQEAAKIKAALLEKYIGLLHLSASEILYNKEPAHVDYFSTFKDNLKKPGTDKQELKLEAEAFKALREAHDLSINGCHTACSSSCACGTPEYVRSLGLPAELFEFGTTESELTVGPRY